MKGWGGFVWVRLVVVVAVVGMLGWGKVEWERVLLGPVGSRLPEVEGIEGEEGKGNGGVGELVQGLSHAMLGGLRGVLAGWVWVQIVPAWEKQQWVRVKSHVEAAVALQPRAVIYWELGGWHFGWNAARAQLMDLRDSSEVRRQARERLWVREAKRLLERGVRANPDRYELWFQLGWLHNQRLGDYAASARYFREAWRRPRAPAYLERFIGYDLEKAGLWREAYEWWREVWFSTSDRSDVQRGWEIVERKLREAEERLEVPREKRVFPK